MGIDDQIQIHTSSASKHLEGKVASGVTISPGMVVKRNTAGRWRPHNVLGGACSPIFAVADIWYGKGIEDTYAAGEKIYLIYASGGDVIWAWLAASQSIVIGDFLTSNADGRLKKIGPTPVSGCIIGGALEAITTVASPARIRVEIFK